jgi:hypothetical protein
MGTAAVGCRIFDAAGSFIGTSARVWDWLTFYLGAYWVYFQIV